MSRRPARFASCALLAAALLSPLFGADPPADPNKLSDYDRVIEPSDREHWSYTPIARPAVPDVRDAAWPRNPIDRFLLAELEAKNRRPNPDASPPQLVRRLYLDVIGLPPTPRQQRLALADRSPQAWNKLVDTLLADPGYGERWGRHWLDLVRYAETNGYERDAVKPHVWRYRDYVIDALNADKPYDRFVVEQLAGDELPDADFESMIATGFNRLGPWDDEPADPEEDRFEQLDDIVRTTSQVFLGLTLGCARCHNHKFDALTAHDYYRMVAVFDSLKRPQSGRAELDLPAGSAADFAAIAERDRKAEALVAEANKRRAIFRDEHLASSKSKLPAGAIAAFRTPFTERSPAENSLVQAHSAALDAELAAAMPEAVKSEIDGYHKQAVAIRASTSDLRRGYFLSEPDARTTATHLLLRGKATSPGPKVEAGVPAVLVSHQPAFPAGEKTSRRRIAFARWLFADENPLTARVIVNRVWQLHFGEGIVRTSSDFGVLGDSPTHPELLDWLAHWFAHDASWSVKKLHRLILTSRAYSMSKASRPDAASDDPTNRTFWRFPYRRLEVEAIRDSMLAASGELRRTMHGPGVHLSVPKEALAGHADPGTIWAPFNEPEAARRTVYAVVKRSLVVPMLEVLDLCDTVRSSERRNVTSVPTQALTLLNGDEANRQARHFAARIERDAGADHDRQIARAFELALCRQPTADETSELKRYLREEAGKIAAESGGTNPPAAERAALVRLCRAIFNLNEFVYTD